MFSVIIPLYNKEKFIKRAIDSILNQSFQEFEIIIVNDGSTDNSANKVKEIPDYRIKLINQPNRGVSVARNRGESEAKYPYLAFLDGDDIWDQNFLLEMKKLIQRFPSAGIYGSNNYFQYPNGKIAKNEVGDLFGGETKGEIGDYFKVFADLQRSPFSNSNLCIPKNVYQTMGGYKVGVKLTEDSDLWCRIAFDYSIAFTTEPLATYFLAQEGSTHSIFENKQFEVVKTLYEAINNKKIGNDKVKSVYKLIALQKMGLIKRGILTGNKRKVISNLIDFSIFKNYPVEYVKIVIVIFIPNFVINFLKKI